MKSPILLLPILLELVLVIAWHREAPTPAAALTPEQREAEIRELHLEIEGISVRLGILESEHGFIPRGAGADNTEPAIPPGTPPASVAAWAAKARPVLSSVVQSGPASTLAFF
jgi:hypothetical protein